MKHFELASNGDLLAKVWLTHAGSGSFATLGFAATAAHSCYRNANLHRRLIAG